MEELNELIDSIGSGVKSIEYVVDSKEWLIKYREEGLDYNRVDTDELIEFLQNA